MRIPIKRISYYIYTLKELSLNIFSFSLLILSQQLLALPLISRSYNIMEFGSIILAFGIGNIFISIFGTSIGNARLLDTDFYNRKYISALYTSILIALPLSLITYLSIFPGCYLEGLFFFIVIIMGSIRGFITSEFRITNIHKQIFSQNLWYFIGMIIGLFLFHLYNNWLYIFLSAELISVLRSVVFLYKADSFKLFKGDNNLSTSNIFNLMLNNGLSYSLSQYDRFIIFPLLGAANVTLFYAVSVCSKVGTLILNPVSNYILGKMATSKKNNKMNILVIIGSFIIIIIYFLFSLLVTPIIVRILYPDYLNDIKGLVLPVSLAGAIMAGASIIKPVAMKVRGVKTYNNGFYIYAFILIVVSIVMCIQYSLLGIAVANILSSCVLLYLSIKMILKVPDIK